MVQAVRYRTREIYLSDLRKLGRSGHAILYTQDGQCYVMKPKYAVKRIHQNGCIDQNQTVSYHKIFQSIVSIRQNGFEVAKRFVREGQSKLFYTRRKNETTQK